MLWKILFIIIVLAYALGLDRSAYRTLTFREWLYTWVPFRHWE